MRKTILVWAQVSTLVFAGQCAAAVSANTVWEVRSVSSDTNGGGFVAGAAGTDMSQFDNKNLGACTSCQSATVNISTTDAVAVGSTTITSTTANFSSALIGNIIEFSGGTGTITAVWKQVLTVPSSTSITIDTSIAASTGMTMNIGGALATIGKALAVMTAQNIIFVKATATYSITANLALANQFVPTNAAPANQLIGYTTSRTDAGRATIQLSTNSNLIAIDATNGQGWYVSNFVIDCNSLTNSRGMNMNTYNVVRNVKVINCLQDGAQLNNGIARLIDSEVTACTIGSGHAAVNSNGQGNSIERTYIHDNVGNGIILGGGGSAVLFSVIANNTGATSEGILISGNGQDIIMNNTVYANGQDGIQFTNNAGLGGNSTVRNNLIVANVRYGLMGYSSAGWGKFPQWDGNAYWLSTGTANRNNADDTGTTNPVNAANPYTNTLDVILGGDPFTNAAGHDFTLSNTTAGKAAKGTATPGAIPGLSQTGAMSFGAFQVAAATSTGANAAFAQ